MHRRDLFRRTLGAAAGLTIISNAPAREFPADTDASKDLARADWKPKFLDEHQNETLIALGEAIVPGSKAALANRFIDELLAAETTDTQKQFLNSLAWMDGECLTRYKTAFVHLTPESQTDFLTFVAYPHTLNIWGGKSTESPGYEHFKNLKSWIARAYYSSEPGMRELGWEGAAPHGEFKGCEHPDEKEHLPTKG